MASLLNWLYKNAGNCKRITGNLTKMNKENYRHYRIIKSMLYTLLFTMEDKMLPITKRWLKKEIEWLEAELLKV
jgi:hypothetical protein